MTNEIDAKVEKTEKTESQIGTAGEGFNAGDLLNDFKAAGGFNNKHLNDGFQIWDPKAEAQGEKAEAQEKKEEGGTAAGDSYAEADPESSSHDSYAIANPGEGSPADPKEDAKFKKEMPEKEKSVDALKDDGKKELNVITTRAGEAGAVTPSNGMGDSTPHMPSNAQGEQSIQDAMRK